MARQDVLVTYVDAPKNPVGFKDVGDVRVMDGGHLRVVLADGTRATTIAAGTWATVDAFRVEEDED